MGKYSKYIDGDIELAKRCLTCALMNTFAECKDEDFISRKLIHIPITVLTECIDKLKNSSEWELLDHTSKTNDQDSWKFKIKDKKIRMTHTNATCTFTVIKYENE